MGLLSDPESGSVIWVRSLRKYQSPLCFLLYVGALVWFVLLARREFNNETYFSENALLPGLVTNEFNTVHESAAKQIYNEFLRELDEKYGETNDMPVPWLVNKMTQLNLEVYTHNFSLKYPYGDGQVFHGTNVYGILRAPRTASLEALVLSAPYRSLSSHEKSTTAGIALMLAFAQFARPQKYWAKDIIFLITEHEHLGIQAWLEAYHGLQSNTETFYSSLSSFCKPGTLCESFEKKMADYGFINAHHNALDPGKLRGRSGSIQAAINLELHDPKIKYIEVKVEGLNGQLPNLDLVNLVHKLCVKSGIHHSYKNSYSWIRTRNKMEDWKNSFWTMMGMVMTQIDGVPNGNHGLFHRFGIEAVTLEGRDAYDPAGTPPKVNSLSTANFYRLGVTLESIFRSLNNLLERFHQSYFYYLLANTNRFISIGQYMPSLVALCLAILLRALSMWVTLHQNNEDENQVKEKKQKRQKRSKKGKSSESELSGDDNTKESTLNEEQSTLRRRKHSQSEVPGEHKDKEVSKKEIPDSGHKLEKHGMSIVKIGANYLIIHLIGYGTMNSSGMLIYVGSKSFKFSPEMSLYHGLIAIFVFVMFITPFLPSLLRLSPMSREEMTLTYILVLVELSTVCLTVGMHNFPLGLLVATVYTPLALITGILLREKRGFVSFVTVWLKRLFCLIVHPCAGVTLAMIAYSRFLVPDEPLWGGVLRGRDAAMQATMFARVDEIIYGNWLYNLCTAVIFPIWVVFWQILTVRV